MAQERRIHLRRPGPRPRSLLADIPLLAAVLLLFYTFVRMSHVASAPLTHPAVLSLSPFAIPGYMALSLLRMSVAFVASVLFSLSYGYAAAHSPWAERILIPILDILQSVPVLGFLSFTVTAFVALDPGTMVGPNLASVFAIFTAQAWNMAFSFYHSLRTIPPDLNEAANVYGLSPWRRFLRLELPAAMIPYVWNSVLSFGASWVFLTASEAVTVASHHIILPGMGSYIATAIVRGNVGDLLDAVLAFVLTIVLLDQVVWRPLIAWSQRFQLTLGPAKEESESWALTLLTRSALLPWLARAVFEPISRFVLRRRLRNPLPFESRPVRPWVGRAILALALVGLVSLLLPALVHLVIEMLTLSAGVYFTYILAGLATLGRVLLAVLLGALWTVPAGVAIGQSPRLTTYLEPFVQNAAAFPANILYGFLVPVLLFMHLSMNFGSILLMMLGTQWYILFNVIAGTQGLPSDLLEACQVFGIQGLRRWRTVILPGIFPTLITGALTAAGGAWNLSILAEITSWGHTRLVAFGLGSFITENAAAGHTTLLFLAVFLMSVLVVSLNTFLWQPLYRLAEARFHVE